MQENKHDYDVIVIGAGISGIDVGYRLQEQCPNKTYTILEARDAIGGTWDLFKYPGIRSDSDLHTFGFPFRPWPEENAIAEAPRILKYLNETAQMYGIDRKIQFRHRLENADWSSDQQTWTLSVNANGKPKTYRCAFTIFCTGYYDYHNPLPAQIPGIENFKGTTIHPQFWPENLDYEGKNVAIIGSGATAITLLPSIAKKAAQTTMIQRSPSFIVALPQHDKLDWLIRSFLPTSWAHRAIRLKYILLPNLFFRFCRTFPNAARNLLRKGAAKLLPKDYQLDPNFQPKYNPWDQRLCVSPKGDFYAAIKKGQADIVTSSIKSVTEDSIILTDSDKIVKPDIIITATGLKLLIAGGAKITVDKEPVRISDKHLYRGIMLQDLPNASIVIGYTNASWTLGADATAQFTTRLLNYMDQHGYAQAVPKVDPTIPMEEESVLNLNSTYITKAQGILPKAGSVGPWRPRSMYFKDLWDAKHCAWTSVQFTRSTA